MARATSEALNQIIAPAVAALGYEFVGFQMFPQGRHSLLRVFIDSPNGITVDDCERVSRQISAVLDVEDPISTQYDLEVSSPGLDRPLFTREHYERFIGKQVRVRLRMPRNERRNYAGRLEAVNADEITILGDGETWVLPLIEIEKANLIPDY